MPFQSESAEKKDGIFLYLLLLMGFFLLLEVSFFIQCNKSYLDDLASVNESIQIPWRILPGIFFFIFIQLSLHFIYCVLVWITTLLNARLFHFAKDQTFLLSIGIWLTGIITILLANQYYFPHSKFAEVMAMIFFNQKLTLASLILFSSLSVIFISVAFFSLIKSMLQQSLYYRFIYTGLLLAGFTGVTFYQTNKPVYSDGAIANKPNIILIGIDSLRPDFLSYFGHKTPTPFLDSVLSQATIFTEAFTPLARTYPAWSSILTGLYPKQNGIRTNLAEQHQTPLSYSLAALLQKQGYETIYATDETRFSNIDKNFGFDQLITPPIGLNDFLIGTFNDFPFSNLLINSKLGRALFPYSYANRPVYVTYEPDSFLDLLKGRLVRPKPKPLFLAVHFCLPHFPFLWRDSPPVAHLGGVERYEASIARVDKQVGDFVNWLKDNQFLDHAIVVFLSDHGEALELPGDRVTAKEAYLPKTGVIPKFYPSMLENEATNQSAGHGTDVLGLTQYRTLLAFKLYGLGKQQIASVTDRVSLLDIKPTVLALLATKIKEEQSGNSLLGYILGKAPLTLPPKHIFLESDFSPEAIRTVFPETRKVLLEGIGLFQIDPKTARLTFKDSMYNMILESKQYADLYGDWVLALYPQNKTYRMPILVNLRTGQWTNDLNSSFAKESPVQEMIVALKSFYGNELDNVSTT